MKLIDKFIDTDTSQLKLTKQELEVFYYITKNLSNIYSLKANDIAKECFCTTTTINRLCKKYGVNGFNDFKAIIEYEQQNDTIVESVTHNLGTEWFIEKIDKTKPIFLFGSGSSHFLANLVQKQLLKHGYIAIVIDDRFFLREVMSKQILLFSNSGKTAPTLDLASVAKKRKITVFSITKKDSILESLSDYTLHAGLTENYESSLSYINHQAQMHLLIEDICRTLN